MLLRAVSSTSPMATCIHLLVFTLLLLLIPISNAALRPSEVVIPVQKDVETSQYVATIKMRTPLVPVKVVVDLAGTLLWVDCDDGYISSSYRPTPCGSAKCQLAKGIGCLSCNLEPRPGCTNDTCSVFPYNPIKNSLMTGGLSEDVIAIQSTDGKNPGAVAVIHPFPFSCATTSHLEGLARGAKGMLGLSRSSTALPTQLASQFSKFPQVFALCLSSSPNSNGTMFFGNKRYMLNPNNDVDYSKSLTYTPLIINPVSTAPIYSEGDQSDEYFIQVKSININAKRVPINTTLLSFDKDGVGGTKISTATPYTTLHTSIYKAVTQAFANAAASMKMSRVASVAPFGVCFSSKSIKRTRMGPLVPAIDLVLHSQDVYWSISRSNSMVQVKDGVMCLGLVDAGKNPRTSIVIGGHQLEDNLLQFDLASSMLGFTSSLLGHGTNCANFNFTSKV
ncbi:PREDICTED: basic 7S globulin-like [Nelumbo nucifera]|uniref:Basic 7S globulin-like n=1 Tax=Nelumbo nucifera TaxID=4432 RepID=A0A1U8A3U5_NELNU|nr:PREDICTED: basic 7S globulin-like [Nelumbo nucifera]